MTWGTGSMWELGVAIRERTALFMKTLAYNEESFSCLAFLYLIKQYKSQLEGSPDIDQKKVGHVQYSIQMKKMIRL